MIHKRDYTLAGPPLATVFPDILLPDQSGALVDLHRARAGRQALVVFHRSARW